MTEENEGRRIDELQRKLDRNLNIDIHDSMTPNPFFQEAGGFLQPSVQSPSNFQIDNPSNGTLILPQQRSNPLKPGSSKESGFIDYVDQKLLGISRRYEKRFNAVLKTESASDVEGRGYEGFKDVATDLSAIIDVVWVSGTREFRISV